MERCQERRAESLYHRAAMVSAAELSRSLRDERPNQDDLRREVERLRIEVELAQRGVMITEEGDDPDAALPP